MSCWPSPAVPCEPRACACRRWRSARRCGSPTHCRKGCRISTPRSKRLSAIVDIGDDSPPLLFLLDEILHGTNSHDRRIGAEALIRNLVGQGSVGMVTTHDLALARIAEDLEPRAANVHFEDHLEGDRVAFDYKLRPGVVRKGNALELMRSIGLKV